MQYERTIGIECIYVRNKDKRSRVDAMLLRVKPVIPRFDVKGFNTRFCDWLILLQIFMPFL